MHDVADMLTWVMMYDDGWLFTCVDGCLWMLMGDNDGGFMMLDDDG